MARPRKTQAAEDVTPTSSQYGETVALEESLAVAPINQKAERSWRRTLRLISPRVPSQLPRQYKILKL